MLQIHVERLPYGGYFIERLTTGANGIYDDQGNPFSPQHTLKLGKSLAIDLITKREMYGCGCRSCAHIYHGPTTC